MGLMDEILSIEEAQSYFQIALTWVNSEILTYAALGSWVQFWAHWLWHGWSRHPFADTSKN